MVKLQVYITLSPSSATRTRGLLIPVAKSETRTHITLLVRVSLHHFDKSSALPAELYLDIYAAVLSAACIIIIEGLNWSGGAYRIIFKIFFNMQYRHLLPLLHTKIGTFQSGP